MGSKTDCTQAEKPNNNAIVQSKRPLTTELSLVSLGALQNLFHLYIICCLHDPVTRTKLNGDFEFFVSSSRLYIYLFNHYHLIYS